MSVNKDVRDFIDLLRKYEGVEVKMGGGGHYIVTHNGRFVVSISATPSDHRWRRNAISQMRRNGMDLNGLATKEKKRDAGGQSPPPLPVIGRPIVPKNVHYVSDLDAKAARGYAVLISEQVAKIYDLQKRGGRKVAHGTEPRLTRVGIAYYEATGKYVPHRNYTTRDVKDVKDMTKLAVDKLLDVASGQDDGRKMTQLTFDQIMYLHDAWAWFEQNDHTFPEVEPVLDVAAVTWEPVTVPDQAVVLPAWVPPEDDVQHEVEQPVSIDGYVSKVDSMLVLRLIAKLAYNGVSEDEAVAFGLEVHEAIKQR